MKTVKRILVFFVSLMLVLYVWGKIYSIQPPLVQRPAQADTLSIRKDLYFLSKECRYRNYRHPEQLKKAADYILQRFQHTGNTAFLQQFSAGNQQFYNVICSVGPETGQRIVVGAHYDACHNQEGADDNASGVAGLLALADLLKNEKLKYRVDFVAYANEEPPFFATKNMGSYVHAASLSNSKVQLKGMISVEMIGYYSDEEGSQDYPLFVLEWFYGNKGNFITVAQRFSNGEFGSYMRKKMQEEQLLPTRSFTAPGWFGGINLSDHRNYWDMGYDAVLVTNTSFFRNKNYHTKDDTAEKLDIQKMGMVVDELYRAIKEMP